MAGGTSCGDLNVLGRFRRDRWVFDVENPLGWDPEGSAGSADNDGDMALALVIDVSTNSRNYMLLVNLNYGYLMKF